MIKKISVSQRTTIISILLVILFVFNFVIIYQVTSQQQLEQKLLKVVAEAQVLSKRIEQDTNKLTKDYNSQQNERLLSTIDQFEQNINNLININQNLAVENNFHQRLGKTKQVWQQIKEEVESINSSTTDREYRQVLTKIREQNIILAEIMQQIVDSHSKDIASNQLLLWGAIILGVGLLVVIFFRIGISKFLVTPMHEISEIIEKIANGNLALQVEVEQDNEVGKIKSNLNKMATNFRNIIEELIKVSDQLLDEGETLSSSAQQGNATIENTNNLIEDISASIEEISASAEEVSSFAEESSSRAKKGDRNIEDTLNSIHEINNSTTKAVEIIQNLDDLSAEINTIIELITNIAEETNLLALNASIEAARAGSSEGAQAEAGQGFAVVAEEIRELAEDTNEATERISDLIQRTQEKTDDGLHAVTEVQNKAQQGEEVAAETRDVFEEINRSSEQTANQIEEVANATQDLAIKSEEVKDGAQQIKTMSDEVTNSAQGLERIARELQEIVEHFRID